MGVAFPPTSGCPGLAAAEPEIPDYFSERDGARYAGLHLLVDLWGAQHLDDAVGIEAALREAAGAARATVLQARLAPLATDIAGAMGPAGIKAALDLVGLHGGAPRSPLLAATADEVAIVRARLETAGLLAS